MNHKTLRLALQAAVLDDLFHGQPELASEPVQRPTRTVYKVSGFIDPARLGAFGAAQIEGVIERQHPGLLASLGERQQITKADIMAILESVALPGEPYNEQIADAILNLITERFAHTPRFDDL